MSKQAKLIERFLRNPKDFSWDELVRMLSHLGYEEVEMGHTSGSARHFNGPKGSIRLHKPHPEPILKRYQMKDVRKFLKSVGDL